MMSSKTDPFSSTAKNPKLESTIGKLTSCKISLENPLLKSSGTSSLGSLGNKSLLSQRRTNLLSELNLYPNRSGIQNTKLNLSNPLLAKKEAFANTSSTLISTKLIIR